MFMCGDREAGPCCLVSEPLALLHSNPDRFYGFEILERITLQDRKTGLATSLETSKQVDLFITF